MRAWADFSFQHLEATLDEQREQFPLWGAVALGAGIGLWFWLPGPTEWTAVLCLAGAMLLLGLSLRGLGGTVARWTALLVMLGVALAWGRSTFIAAPRLDRPVIATFDATVIMREPRVADGKLRLTLAPINATLPPLVRVTMDMAKVPPGIQDDSVVRLRARLAPPPPMALPGGHDFARDAWFLGLGAVGKTLGDVVVVKSAQPSGLDGLRGRLDTHIQQSLPGPAGTIATAFVSGNQNAISKEDADAMRRSGLAHLLSVSGLHIAAVVAATMFVSLRLLALSETLALRLNLMLVSAGFAAAAGIGYTLLTGAQVPTVRSCVAALLVLAGMALGREALSLRLVATGAVVVMAVVPEALVGPSFQMSFASVATIIALHEFGPVKRFLAARDEHPVQRLGRHLASLLLSGLAVELALMPFALYHFHRAGFYGVIANLIAIPLTTFVSMPLEAAALALDQLDMGHPLWIATGWSLDLLLLVAHRVAAIPGAVAMLPTMPTGAFAAMVVGGLWCCLCRGALRPWGLAPLAAGALVAATTPIPDLLVSGDGRHVALVAEDGMPLMLRERAGEFTRSQFAESAGFDGETGWIEDRRGSRCNPDACSFEVDRGGRKWRVLAFRSPYLAPWSDTINACAGVDIVVAERRLPEDCRPRWLKLDRTSLAQIGGLTIRFGPTPAIASVGDQGGNHPWTVRGSAGPG